jgi:hypothetical protein
MRNWVDLAQDREYLRVLCECDIEPPGSINHGVRVSIKYIDNFNIIYNPININ